MTEFEAATLALQQGQLWAAIAIPVVAAVVGLLQAGVVVYGIRAMIRANEGRAEADRQRAEADRQRAEADQQRAEADRQRAEAEVARHAETMTALDARHTETMRALEGLIKGMETVIERTGGRA